MKNCAFKPNKQSHTLIALPDVTPNSFSENEDVHRMQAHYYWLERCRFFSTYDFKGSWQTALNKTQTKKHSFKLKKNK